MHLLILAALLLSQPSRPGHGDPHTFPREQGITRLDQPSDVDPEILRRRWPELGPALALLQRGQAAEAEARLKALGESAPALNLRAQILRRAGDLEGALALAKQAQALDPKEPLHPFQQALTHFAELRKATGMGRWTTQRRTQAAYERTLELDPAHVYARYYVFYTSLQTPAFLGGDKAAALALAEEGLKHDPAFRLLRADALRLLDREAEALSDYDAALDRGLFKTWSWAGAVDLASRKKDFPRAEKYAGFLLKGAPEKAEAWQVYGDLQRDLGRLGEARKAYAKGLELAPADKELARRLEALSKGSAE